MVLSRWRRRSILWVLSLAPSVMHISSGMLCRVTTLSMRHLWAEESKSLQTSGIVQISNELKSVSRKNTLVKVSKLVLVKSSNKPKKRSLISEQNSSKSLSPQLTTLSLPTTSLSRVKYHPTSHDLMVYDSDISRVKNSETTQTGSVILAQKVSEQKQNAVS